MKRYRAALVLLLLFLNPLFVLSAAADNSETTVYITQTGYAYHINGCGHLRSKIPISLREAVESGHTPCKDCHPPVPDFPYTIQTPAPKRSTGSNGSRSSSGGSHSSSGSSSRSNLRSLATPSPSPTRANTSSSAGFLARLPDAVSFFLTLLLVPLSLLAFVGFWWCLFRFFGVIARFVDWLKRFRHH